MWDVWFHGQIVYSNIEHLSNIDEIDEITPVLVILVKVYIHLLSDQLILIYKVLMPSWDSNYKKTFLLHLKNH